MSTIYRTYENYIGFNEDNGLWGTWQAPNKFLYLPVQAVPKISQATLDAATVRQLESRHVGDIEAGYKFVTLTISGQVPITTSDPAFLFLLKHALQDVTLSGAGADKTHVFVPYNDFHALGLSVTCAVGKKERYKMSGCRITRLKFSATAAGALLWEADFTGKWYDRDQTQDIVSVTMKSTHPMWWASPMSTVTFQIPTGTDVSNFYSWEIVLNNKIDTGEAVAGQLGSADPVHLPKLGADLTMVVKRRADFTDGKGSNQSKFHEWWKAIHTDGHALTDVQAKIEFKDGQIGVTGAYYTIRFEPNIMILPETPPASSVEYEGTIAIENIQFTGVLDGANPLLKITTISEATTPATETPP